MAPVEAGACRGGIGNSPPATPAPLLDFSTLDYSRRLDVYFRSPELVRFGGSVRRSVFQTLKITRPRTVHIFFFLTYQVHTYTYVRALHPTSPGNHT